jgi:hypothetical protein
MAEEKLNLNQKLAKIRAIADVAKKNKSGYGYKYADLEEILPKVKGGMEKYGVSLRPHITPSTSSVEQVTLVSTKTDKQGVPYETKSTEFMVSGDMVWQWVDDETGETIESPWLVVGSQSDPSQAFGTGITYSERYFLIAYFQIPVTDSNPEDLRRRQEEAKQSEELATLKVIIEKIDESIRVYLSDHPDEKSEIAAVCKKYISSGDYKKIKSVELAGKLFQELQNIYNKEAK